MNRNLFNVLQQSARSALIIGIIVFCCFWIAQIFGSQTQRVELTAENHTTLEGFIDDKNINHVLADIAKSDRDKPFYIYIESPGGSVFAGRKLVKYLQSTDRNIVCIGSTAISMAFVSLQACPTRLVTQDSVLMTHEIGNKVEGTLKQIQTDVEIMKQLESFYNALMAKRMGLTVAEYEKHVDPEWWMIGSKTALENRAADGEVTVTCSKDLEKGIHLTQEGVVSTCPLL